MASSSSSLDLSISARVLLLLLLLGCCRLSSAAALPTETVDRWRNPCGGETVVDDYADETVTMTTGESRDAFAMLSGRSTALKHLVNSLKNAYVLARFGEARIADQFVNSSNAVTGSPSWTVHNDSMRETLLVCYENLARLAVLTKLTREGEESAASIENHHFASRFQEIENHHEAGLYVLMCSLHGVMESWGIVPMSPDTVAEVANIRFEAAPNNAYRHGRDYLVLLVLENSADKLSSSFDHLVGQVASRATTSIPQ